MATAAAVIKKAASYIGVKEKPKNSNNVKFNTDYYGHPVSGKDYPWCVTFVWDVFRLARASALFYGGKKTAYCPAVLSWGRSKGLTVKKSAGKKGDIVLFDWNHDGEADHIGFIEKKNATGSYKTIEGNTAVGNDSNGGEVMRRTRKQSDIIAIIRPKYSAAAKKSSAEKAAAKKAYTGGWPTIPAKGYIGQGDKGPNVLKVQKFLRWCGYNIAADKIFGPKTKTAVVAFQKAKKLTPDGLWGKKTQAAAKKVKK